MVDPEGGDSSGARNLDSSGARNLEERLNHRIDTAEAKLAAKLDRILLTLQAPSDQGHAPHRQSNKIEGSDVEFEGADLKFEALDVKFEGSDVKFEGSDLKFEGSDVKFEGSDLKFEGSDVKFEDADVKFEALDVKFDGADDGGCEPQSSSLYHSVHSRGNFHTGCESWAQDGMAIEARCAPPPLLSQKTTSKTHFLKSIPLQICQLMRREKNKLTNL
ncbi:hypothetical protein T484DRAFT_3291640 [Baffinella frigidus]|nr:hypothetical protein T484DRAFT_3291640 [Cryptophyta sp. CCMP2293]